MSASAAISIAIPTYGRNAVLVDTVAMLLALRPAAAEILLIDQTPVHDAAAARQLKAWHEAGAVRWLHRKEPSIPCAMNEALREAACDIVLFLDDDIRPDAGLVAAHGRAHEMHPGRLVAGRVIQPWQEGVDPASIEHSSFASTQASMRQEFMGGNFSVDRRLALALGGFDENFVRVAYRFEADFARRWQASGRSIAFEPAACIHHLKVSSGGTRTFGEHLSTWRPDHAVGAYYFAWRWNEFAEFLRRPLRSVATRYHLRRPWRILPTLAAEFGGMLWALGLAFRGPRFAKRARRTPP